LNPGNLGMISAHVGLPFNTHWTISQQMPAVAKLLHDDRGRRKAPA